MTLVNLPRPTPEEMRTLTESVLTLEATSRLQSVIGQRFPLDQAAEAHRAIESRATVEKLCWRCENEEGEGRCHLATIQRGRRW